MKRESDEHVDHGPIRAVVKESGATGMVTLTVSASTEFYGNVTMTLQSDRCTEEFFERGQSVIDFVKANRLEHPDREWLYNE